MVEDTLIVLLATLDTKVAETHYLCDRLRAEGCLCQTVDTSVQHPPGQLGGSEKVRAMDEAVARARSELGQLAGRKRIAALVGIGGGTGGQLAATIMQDQPLDTPKVLVTTLAFDPRRYSCTSGMIVIPTVTDLFGLNPSVRRVLDDAARVVASLALVRAKRSLHPLSPSAGLSTLGVTHGFATHCARSLEQMGKEFTIFHANGYGGNAMAMAARQARLTSAIDGTLHEVARLVCEPGEGVVRSDRLSAMRNLPRVLLPGGTNFFTREAHALRKEHVGNRKHYAHSPEFMHVALDEDEMASVGAYIASELSSSQGLAALVLPQGGFSSEDRRGGRLENTRGREAFASGLRSTGQQDFEIVELPQHINSPETASIAIKIYNELVAENL